MKIIFIRPNIFDCRSSDAMEPLSIAILKSLTPADVETVFYDERLAEIPFDATADLVAITVETYTARRSYQIADNFRSRGIKVVMGGYHPTFLPDECLEHADSVVCGDAEGVWLKILADTQSGNLKRIYQDDGSHNLIGIDPDRSIFKGKRYAPISLVQYSRGCKFNCDFCSIRAFYGSNLRQRPVSEVVDEIISAGRKHVFLVDDNLFVNRDKARALFEALIPLKITWSCQISIDITKHPDLVKLMARSGCITALIGFESLDISSLKQMNKQWNLRGSDYDTAIKVIQDHGIMIYGTFVFGYDTDTKDSFKKAVDFALRHKFYLANFNPLTPTPATPLFDRLKKDGRLIYDKWWLHPDFKYGHAMYHPRGMTADELTEGCFNARKSFNTYSSIARRLMTFKTNLRSPYRTGVYLMSNMISRREIYRKQGRQLGAKPGARVECYAE